MKDGFIRVAAATPVIKVADCDYNATKIMELIQIAQDQGVKLIVFPELCVTGYTCGDLFLQDTLLRSALKQVERIKVFSEGKEPVIVVGFPYYYKGKLYNTAAVIQGGRVLGLVPKMSIPNYTEFYEARHFTSGMKDPVLVEFLGQEVYFGSRLLFQCKDMPEFILGVEICEDLWIPLSPGISHCVAGATLIANLSASDELTGKDDFRRALVKSQSARLVCGYIYSDAGEGESTTDLVFAGHNLIAENGIILKESVPFENGMILTELDLIKLRNERRRMNTYLGQDTAKHVQVSFSFLEDAKDYELPLLELTRYIDPAPFVPSDLSNREKRCRDIIQIQARGLKTRIENVGAKHVVLGISGGLDSTLALLVTQKAFEMLGLDKKGIITVTMPCFGTTDRTYRNSIALTQCIGTTLLEIPIGEAVELHFRDIGHDLNQHDLTYENSQARERTQVLMDIAGKYNGFVVGTGDMSELALGWATYNGDHMSMYGVNASVPKTLVRFLVEYFGKISDNQKLKEVLTDILSTPVSPELLPPKDGEIMQKTEDIVGPYELHDFFLYYILRFGFEPRKVYRLAKIAFAGTYGDEVILKWLKVFYRRFFSQQYKRSCLPDGPKVGSVSVSPRGDLRMPSDASAAMWLKELEEL
ncbi:NAD(+) synthase [Mobilitalea sibirica]|uniref:Glutamine-dependent NAD(+) synthetase n=1 Tax=Mobilitalea sibirica TaxID=1462919 RepID=A0A8J7HBW5_9FIRM|nr:NAD(+) synthase [Mobilitalea sibirica]MBH1941561.1 NAD(+) synthase [Mobilitalea sibirica]